MNAVRRALFRIFIFFVPNKKTAPCIVEIVNDTRKYLPSLYLLVLILSWYVTHDVAHTILMATFAVVIAIWDEAQIEAWKKTE